jgi:hypothetical protein
MRERRIYDRRRTGLRTHVMLTRTLRSYIENGLRDLVDLSTFQPIVLEGDDPYGQDDVVEVTVWINDNAFLFHIEPQDAGKPQGLLGVEHEQTRMDVTGPATPETWAKIEQFVRFASK